MALSEDPRARLLEAAGQVFADKGFAGATVRDIIRTAGVNLAAVNYYFQDKQHLYLEVVKRAACGAPGAKPPEWPAGTPPAVKLRDFIHVLLGRMMDGTRPAWHTPIMMREMARPTSACTELVRDYIAPMARVLEEILAELLPAGTSRTQRFLVAFSIVGQCLYYAQNRPVARLLMGEEDYARLDRQVVTDHVCRFSLAALGLEPPLGATAKRTSRSARKVNGVRD